MKKEILLVIVLCLLFNPFSSKAQKNVVKVNVLSFGVKNIYLSYERVLTDKKSVALDFSFMPSVGLPFSGVVKSIASNNGSSDAADLRYSNMKISGFSIAPEFRFYTARRKEAPRGFYIAPYIKYQYFGLKGNYTSTYHDNDLGRETTGYFTNSGYYSVIGAGARIGAQWLIADRFSIDWTIIGLGLGAYKFDIKESATGVGPNYYNPGSTSGFNSGTGWPSHSYTYTKNSGELSGHTLFPQFTTRLFLGFAF